MNTIDQLFAAIDRDPDDASAYLVLADALLQSNDPRGELIEVQRSLTTKSFGERAKLLARERELIAELRKRLFGPGLATNPMLEVEVKHGFADVLRLKNLPPTKAADAIEAISKSQDARLLRELQILSDEETNGEMYEILNALEERSITPPRSLRRLRLGHAFEIDGSDRMLEEDEFGDDDLRAVLRVFDSIEEIVVDLGLVAVTWAPLESETLRRFTWIAPLVHSHELKPLLESKLPALEAFTLWTGGEYAPSTDDYGEDVDYGNADLSYNVEKTTLVKLLAMLDRCTKLRELGFPHYAGKLAKLTAILAKHETTKRIEVLDVGHREIDDDDADAILDLVAAAPNIKRLGVDGAFAIESVQRRLAKKLALDGDWADSSNIEFRVMSAME